LAEAAAAAERFGPNQSTQQTGIAELELENSRLRRLVTNLLLEKMNLEVKARSVT